VLVGLLLTGAALGADDRTSRAAELFEQGVRQFKSADYEAATRSFLAADDSAPNTRALVNAITAAQRAGLYLLVAQTAERALARRDLDAAGATFARDALAEARRSLTQVEVSCATSPCTITLDGSPTQPGSLYMLPGTHDFVASGPNGATASEHVSTAAGAAYRVTLSPSAPASPEIPQTSKPDSSGVAHESVHTKPLSPALFYVGAAGTAVLVGLTIWSGTDTLSAKSSATESTWPHVQELALRTDLFLAGAALLGGATAAAGLWLVDWGSNAQAAAVPLPGGAALLARGRF
jgi:hypothetical protein